MAFDVEGARKAGYTDAEIADELGRTAGFDVAAARKAKYSDSEIIAQLAKTTASSAADRIPGLETEAQQQARRAASEAATSGAKALGAVEAIPATVSAMAAPVAGSINWLNQLVIEGLKGNLSDPEASKRISGAFDQGLQAMTYQPRTQAGQEATGAVADAAAQLIPLAGLGGQMATLSQASRASAPAAAVAAGAAADGAGTAARAVQRTATTLPRRAWAAISRDEPAPAARTPGTMGSAGAAGTDIATQRVATAESLGLTGDAALTRGQATRDPAQLKFETETAKMPEQGAALRQRRVAQNDVLLRNFDAAVDQTGAEAPTLRAVGQVVDQALVKQWEADKRAVHRAYQQAHQSPEAQRIVDQALPVTIGEGDRALTSTPMTFINAQPTGVPAVALIDAARQYAVKLGIAEMRDGDLVPRPATIQQLEEWRTAISQATGYDAPEIRQSTILKGLIDAQTEPAAGPLYRQARGMRRRLAENYEDRAVIAKLLNGKRGMGDRQVALEDVFSHSILKGSLDDVRNVRRVLHRSGTDGAQAWRELQGQTLKWMRDEATKSVAADGAGNRVISPAALDKAVRSLEHDGKLDFIFGKRGAQQLRDINDIAQVAKTVPPEAGINFSNTATTLLTAFADLGISGASGVPAPLATATRLGLKHIKDQKLRRRIDDALTATQRPPGAKPKP